MQTYRFDDFELDLGAFELRRHGKPVHLERRPLDLLALLVTQPGRLVTREEIIAALWPPDIVVDFDSGLNTLVRKVRRALGDSAESPRFIETVPTRGYRFVGALTPQIHPLPAKKATLLRRWRKAGIHVILALLIVASAALLVGERFESNALATRIAVLPFEDLAGDDTLAFLAAGLAEDTRTALGGIDPANLRVVADGSFDPDLIVVSSLRLDGSMIRVNSRLLRVADGEQIWAASLDRELTNVLGLQRELSVGIAEQIRIRLSPDVAAAIDRRQTQNPAAYALYLKGRYEWAQLTPASTRRALQYFEQATTEDPSYALAWAGLAFGLITATRTADADPAVVIPAARDALRRAQELGPDLAETQYALGYAGLFLDLDARAAERGARRAIELDPDNAQAHMLLGVTLPLLDQNTEASEMMRRARELDPTFALAFANSANVALQAGDPVAALELAQQTIAINPQFWLGHYYVGRARDQLGDPAGALLAYADAARLSDGHSLTFTARAGLLARIGRADEVWVLLDEMKSRAARRYMPAYAFAVVHAGLGDVDGAFEWLDKAIEARDLGLWSLPDDRRLESLRSDERFAALLARCGCVAGEDAPR